MECGGGEASFDDGLKKIFSEQSYPVGSLVTELYSPPKGLTLLMENLGWIKWQRPSSLVDYIS